MIVTDSREQEQPIGLKLAGLEGGSPISVVLLPAVLDRDIPAGQLAADEYLTLGKQVVGDSG